MPLRVPPLDPPGDADGAWSAEWAPGPLIRIPVIRPVDRRRARAAELRARWSRRDLGMALGVMLGTVGLGWWTGWEQGLPAVITRCRMLRVMATAHPEPARTRSGPAGPSGGPGPPPVRSVPPVRPAAARLRGEILPMPTAGPGTSRPPHKTR